MATQLKQVLAALIQDIAQHRVRSGELATIRGFWAWQPVWLPAMMPAVILDHRGAEASR